MSESLQLLAAECAMALQKYLATHDEAGLMHAYTLGRRALNLQVGDKPVTRLVSTFAEGNVGEAIAYVGSSGYLEIAINKGNASRTLGIGRGTAVVLTK